MKTLEKTFIALGILFVAAGVTLPIIFGEPNSSVMHSYRVVLGLGAACIGALIPGFIELDGKIGELAFRSGGAIALFLLIYLVNPPEWILNLL